MGSNFIRFLYNRYPGYRILNLDALTYAGNPDNLMDIEQNEVELAENEKRYVFIKGDICDRAGLETLFYNYKIDAVIHFAAETHVDRSFFNVGDFVRTNIEGTRTLVEQILASRVPRFVHISTDEIYGNVPTGFSTEEAVFSPSNPYSASKAGADLLVQAYIKTHKLPALITRSSNNYGPYQYPEKLIPLAITNFLENKKIPVHGSGKHIRSWLYVQDFCSALDAIFHRAGDNSIYNISGDHRSNLEIINLVAGILNKKTPLLLEHVNDRPSADFRYAPDSSKLQRDLGWSPQHNFDVNIRGAINWYIDHRQWWEDIKTKEEYIRHYEKQSKGQWN